MPESAIPPAIPVPSYRSTLRPFLPSPSSASPKYSDSKSVLKTLAMQERKSGPAKQRPSAHSSPVPSSMHGSPKTPIRCRRSLATASALCSPEAVRPLPRSTALSAVNAVSTFSSPRRLVACNDAAAFFRAYSNLLDAVQQLCQGHDTSDPPSPRTPPSHGTPTSPIVAESAAAMAELPAAGGSALQTPKRATAATSQTSSCGNEFRSVFALDQALLLDEPELTLLVLTRMLSIVSHGSTGEVSDGEAVTWRVDHGELSGRERVAGMLQVAADGLHVATHCVLACTPVVLPPPPSGESLPHVLEWVSQAQAAVDALARQPPAGLPAADSASSLQQHVQAVSRSKDSPLQAGSSLSVPGGELLALPAPLGPSADENARLKAAHPKLHAALAFLEGNRGTASEPGSAWFGAVYAWVREGLADVRAEGATVFQNLLAATSDTGVPVLHEAVLLANIDAVELLLMLGASPLQRAPLNDGTPVHWQHGIATAPRMRAAPLCSNELINERLSNFCCRPAAWDPVLKTVTGSVTAEVTPALPSGPEVVISRRQSSAPAAECTPAPAPALSAAPGPPADLAAAIAAADTCWPEWLSMFSADVASPREMAAQGGFTKPAVCSCDPALGAITATGGTASHGFSEVCAG